MAKVKVINNKLDSNLNGGYFNDTPSNTIFSFGKFFVTTNFDRKTTIDYTNSLSSFVRPVTLETLDISEKQSEIFDYYTTNAVLNLDKSDLNTFVRFGSAYEFLRVSVQNIILNYPGSLFANSQSIQGGNSTYKEYTYDEVSNISTFYVPVEYFDNTFGIVYNAGNETIPDDNELKNINDSYLKYVIWSTLEVDTLYPIVGYTGNTVDKTGYYIGTTGQTSLKYSDYVKLEVEGNPFSPTDIVANGRLDFHIRPNNVVFEEFRAVLNSYEQNIVSQRERTDGFTFTLKDPTLLEDGKIIYSDSQILWITGDKYNIDISTSAYQKFLRIVLTIGAKYDKIKTDLIARFLTPASLKTYDFTEEGKINKLLKIYGREFDQMRQFIDSLVHINKVSYDKINNIPDQLIKNMSDTFGWDYFSLVNEEELVDGFLTIDDKERNLNDNILPAEIDIELWRRIINNTSYFWKSKGTRHAIKSMFLLIGIPEPFINITEYVYTVDGKIDPNSVPLIQSEFPSNSLPYDTGGYPVAPLETSDFYFQLSGNTDSGQAYLDVFRMAGFNLSATVDNKKSWVQASATTRIHNTTPQYYQEDSKLVINTKEIDVALDTARGIEYDVWDYVQKDFEANSSGYTLPYSYVNISLPYADSENTFQIPSTYNNQGDFEVRYNGILLNAPKTGTTLTDYQADYSINYSANTFTISGTAINSGSRRDVIQATFVNSGTTSSITGVSIQYIVTRLQATNGSIYLDLPSYPRGDLQLTINGIALTKGTAQFTADYILDPANTTGSSRIIIQNPDIVTFLNSNPTVQVAYMEVAGSDDINLRSEVVRVDSFNTSKIYFNSSANKYVYKLNYKITNTCDVKFLINGIALEPNSDYNVNVQNLYEIFLPKGIKYGDVITSYYLVADSSAFTPVIGDNFGLGDISDLSFLEFIELIQRKIINTRNRKVVSDFKGGWYPALLRIYEDYLERALLSDDNPLQSNGYTFQNLYPFLSKYNAFFQRFVDQLLPATIILKRGGLLIRNSVFTKQKHWYKRGVNVASGTTGIDLRGNTITQYFGDDGSEFKIVQDAIPPYPPVTLFVETIPGVLGSLITGGQNIVGYDKLTEYGIEYRKTVEAGDWMKESKTGSLTTNSFGMTLNTLENDTIYDYRAYVKSNYSYASGNTLQATMPPPLPPVPSISTQIGLAGATVINNSGGKNIIGYNCVDYYGMQYKDFYGSSWTTYPVPLNSGPLSYNAYTQDICGLTPDSDYIYRAYMVIDGAPYYGNSIGVTTPPAPEYPPSAISNGNAINITETTFNVHSSSYDNYGNPETVLEHGVLWTANSVLGAESSLRYSDPLPAGIYKSSHCYDIITDENFSNSLTGLPGDTTIYYRTFIRNCVGAGYDDDIRQANTLAPAPEYPPSAIYNGSATNITETTFNVQSSSYDCYGNPEEVLEYGVLWTCVSILGTESALRYTNPLHAGICKSTCCGDVITDHNFSNCLTGLPGDTTIYYRTFIRNCVGAGYDDDIRQANTCD